MSTARRARRSDAPVFAALGHETRWRLVGALCAAGAMSIVQLTSGTALTRQAVTWTFWPGPGWCARSRSVASRLWELRAEQLREARRSLDLISQQWDRALHRLRLAVEA